MRTGRRSQGLTLIELCTTLAVAAIICTIALPALSQLRQHQSLVTSTNALVHALQLTRIQAITSRQAYLLCPAGKSGDCQKTTDWSHGWQVVPAKAPSAHTLLLRGEAGKGVRLQSTVGRTQVRYNPDGTSAGTNVTFTLCNTSGSHIVVVNNTGRVRSARTDATC